MSFEIQDLLAAIEAAERWLLAEAREEFSETRHVLSFPRRAGFRAREERQTSDVFARAVLAGVLLDAAALDEDAAFVGTVSELARREADYVASRKLTDRAGGWSYFPELIELPPDADSLSAALLLFARASPERVGLCEEAIRIALSGARPDGALATWLVAPDDDPASKRAMRRGVSRFWGERIDVDVCAHFYYALRVHDAARFDEVTRRGARYVEARQEACGVFPASWYHGRAFGTGLAIRLLRTLGEGETAIARALDFFVTHQRGDGGWEVFGCDPQETALALWVFAVANETPPDSVLDRAVESLLDYQSREGHWGGWPWIRMEVARARGDAGSMLTYASRTVTAAFCLRSLLWARRVLARRRSAPAALATAR